MGDEVFREQEGTAQEGTAQEDDVPYEQSTAPGERFQYNNSGYYLLGVVIEKASGKSYEEYLAERIFKPLELKATYYDRPDRVIHNRANGYRRNGLGGVRNALYLDMSQPFSAGAIASTVEDLVKWQRSLIKHQVITEESWTAMITPGKLNDGKSCLYGFGLFPGESDGHKVIRHGGGINGFRSELAYYPDHDITIAVLSNTEASQPGRIAKQVPKHVLGQ